MVSEKLKKLTDAVGQLTFFQNIWSWQISNLKFGCLTDSSGANPNLLKGQWECQLEGGVQHATLATFAHDDIPQCGLQDTTRNSFKLRLNFVTRIKL